jgi:hypothetical protein
MEGERDRLRWWRVRVVGFSIRHCRLGGLEMGHGRGSLSPRRDGRLLGRGDGLEVVRLGVVWVR